MDVSTIAVKDAEDVYGTFNILLRRKPEENNFKAILESIRDPMNESCTVPDWLHNIFLGYGNPSAAQWANMPDLLDTVDFKDTFLGSDHLRRSFPDYQVCFIGPDGNEVFASRTTVSVQVAEGPENQYSGTSREYRISGRCTE